MRQQKVRSGVRFQASQRDDELDQPMEMPLVDTPMLLTLVDAQLWPIFDSIVILRACNRERLGG